MYLWYKEVIELNTYRTTEVATAIGIHPNTVRLYEELGLIPTPERESNGYRIFTEFHIQQFLLARTAFQIEVLQGGLRKKIVSVVKLSAHKQFDEALILTQEYLEGVRMERNNAEEAIQIVQDILSGEIEEHRFSMKRKEVSEYGCRIVQGVEKGIVQCVNFPLKRFLLLLMEYRMVFTEKE